MNSYEIQLLTAADARDILTWRYPIPYDFYDPPECDDLELIVQQFLNPDLQFHRIQNTNKHLIGFCSFGADGQVNGGSYSEPALDIGLGMKPEHTNLGNGHSFFSAILAFALGKYVLSDIRLTVAQFNRRALALYHQFNFVKADEFIDPSNGVGYDILLRSTDK